MGVMQAQGVTGTKASAFPLFPSSLEAMVSTKSAGERRQKRRKSAQLPSDVAPRFR
jgi:hypothetical protein